MNLYGYWRSSASYRVRIALNLKGIDVEHIAINLKDGEQLGGEFHILNSQSLVPVLRLDDGTLMTQSLAIMEYLDEAYPENPLLPADPVMRTRIRAAAQSISSDTSPIQNLRVLKYLRSPLGHSQEQVDQWAKHWIQEGLTSLESQISASGEHNVFLFGDKPGLAECVLIPQIYNARRFKVDMSALPNLDRIDAACQKLEAFIKAHPDQQADKV